LVIGVSVTNNPVKKFFIDSYAGITQGTDSGSGYGGSDTTKDKKKREKEEEELVRNSPPEPEVETPLVAEEVEDTTTPDHVYEYYDIFIEGQDPNKIGYSEDGQDVSGYYPIKDSDGNIVSYRRIAQEEGGPTDADVAYVNYNLHLL